MIYLYIAYNKYEKAIEFSLKAIQLNIKEPYYWSALGDSYLLNGQYKRAIDSYLKATEINPNIILFWS